MQSKQSKTTIEIWSSTRDGIKLLAANEAADTGVPIVYSIDYLARLVARELKDRNIRQVRQAHDSL